MPHPTVPTNKVDVMKIIKSALADKQSNDLSLTSCIDACSKVKGNFCIYVMVYSIMMIMC